VIKINFISIKDKSKTKFENEKSNLEQEYLIGQKYSICKGILPIYTKFHFNYSKNENSDKI